jgi:hypothetical protein
VIFSVLAVAVHGVEVESWIAMLWWGAASMQVRLRHANAKTTLDTYGRIWPESDESTLAAVDAAITARREQRRNSIEAAQ